MDIKKCYSDNIPYKEASLIIGSPMSNINKLLAEIAWGRNLYAGTCYSKYPIKFINKQIVTYDDTAEFYDNIQLLSKDLDTKTHSRNSIILLRFSADDQPKTIKLLISYCMRMVHHGVTLILSVDAMNKIPIEYRSSISNIFTLDDTSAMTHKPFKTLLFNATLQYALSTVTHSGGIALGKIGNVLKALFLKEVIVDTNKTINTSNSMVDRAMTHDRTHSILPASRGLTNTGGALMPSREDIKKVHAFIAIQNKLFQPKPVPFAIGGLHI